MTLDLRKQESKTNIKIPFWRAQALRRAAAKSGLQTDDTYEAQ